LQGENSLFGQKRPLKFKQLQHSFDSIFLLANVSSQPHKKNVKGAQN